MKSPELKTMTYGKLMREVSKRMDPTSAKRHPLVSAIVNFARQFPIWTRTFQNRLLFDGLEAQQEQLFPGHHGSLRGPLGMV